jgi:hypothetical protein
LADFGDAAFVAFDLDFFFAGTPLGDGLTAVAVGPSP